MSQNEAHNVLQLHGGGSLVLSGLLKCVVLKKTTGRRIKDLFQTIIADSGGTIVGLCLEKMSEEDLLGECVNIIGNTLPSKSFYYTQTFSRGQKRFDNSVLHTQLKDILQGATLGEFKGNLFVGAHEYGEGPITFQKFTGKDGVTHYKNASSGTPLSAIAKMTSTIPGVYDELIDHDPEYAGAIYLDALINQPPFVALYKVQKDDPTRPVYYLQMGNIEDNTAARSLLARSAMTSQVMNLHWKYRVPNLHLSHLADAGEVIGDNNVDSLITYSRGKFSPADPSIDQLTRLVVETLADVSRRKDEYTQIALRLNNNEPLCMSVDEAIEELKIILDPMMKKQKLRLCVGEPIPDTFPSRKIVWVDPNERPYQLGHYFGRQARFLAPGLCNHLIANDLKIGDAFQLAKGNGPRKLTLSPSQRHIEPE